MPGGEAEAGQLPALESVDVGRICHEVRKPIAAIQAFAEILWDELSGPLTAEQREHVAVLLRNAQRLDWQVSDLYDLAEHLSGPPVLEPSSCDLEGLCYSVQDSLAALYAASRVGLRVESDGPLAHRTVDARRLEVVLRRLLETALRRSTPGSNVTLMLAEGTPGVRLVVADEGASLDEAERRRLFEPLERAESQRLGAGLGFELHVCRQTVGALGGTLAAENNAPRGLRFVLALA